MRGLALSLLVFPLLADPGFPSWRYRKPVAVPAAGSICAVRLDRDVYVNSRPDLGDLRIGRSGEEIPYVLELLADQQIIAELNPARSEDPRTNTTTLLFDLRAAGLPHDRIRLESGDTFFYRAAEVESSADGRTWKYLAGGFLYRLPGDESLALSFPEQHDRYVRLRIENRNDRPVPFAKGRILALERRVEFLPEASGQHWIYYGNQAACAPVYDLPIILRKQRALPIAVLKAGPQHENPDYRPSPSALKPWTERNPLVLGIILAFAIAGLGYVTVRFLLLARKREKNFRG